MSQNADMIFPLGYFAHTWTYYIVGTGENKAQIKWLCNTWPGNPNVTGKAYRSETHQSSHPGSTIAYKSGEASSIYPLLRIRKNEVKILVECAFRYGDCDRKFPDGSSTQKVPVKDAFNFLLLSPKEFAKVTYFPAVTIFIPTGKAFSEEAPK